MKGIYSPLSKIAIIPPPLIHYNLPLPCFPPGSPNGHNSIIDLPAKLLVGDTIRRSLQCHLRASLGNCLLGTLINNLPDRVGVSLYGARKPLSSLASVSEEFGSANVDGEATDGGGGGDVSAVGGCEGDTLVSGEKEKIWG